MREVRERAYARAVMTTDRAAWTLAATWTARLVVASTPAWLTSTTTLVTFTDAAPNLQRRFYRVRQLP